MSRTKQVFLFGLLFIFVCSHPLFAKTSKRKISPKISSYTTEPLLTSSNKNVSFSLLAYSGQTFPTGEETKKLTFIGKPSGMALNKDSGHIELFVTHAMGSLVTSQPQSPLINRGSFITRLTLAKNGVSTANKAYESLFVDTDPKASAAALDNLGAASVGTTAHGFDQNIYFTGEKSAGLASFDKKGGEALALINNKAYVLPALGHFQKNNITPLPANKNEVISLLITKSKPEGLASQLYLYVGAKDPTARSPLQQNGLTGGKLYVFRTNQLIKENEGQFSKKDSTVLGNWAEIYNADNLTEANLEKETEKLGAFDFVRLGEGHINPKKKGSYYFVTTGGDEKNNLNGRIFELTYNPINILNGPTQLKVLFDANENPTFKNPEQMAINNLGQMMLVENQAKEQNRLWLFNPVSKKLVLVGQADLKDLPKNSQIDFGGISDASSAYGSGTWLVSLQIPSLKSPQVGLMTQSPRDPKIVEGGQLVLVTAK